MGPATSVLSAFKHSQLAFRQWRSGPGGHHINGQSVNFKTSLTLLLPWFCAAPEAIQFQFPHSHYPHLSPHHLILKATRKNCILNDVFQRALIRLPLHITTILNGNGCCMYLTTKGIEITVNIKYNLNQHSIMKSNFKGCAKIKSLPS